jgi:hypothetical protein
MHKFFSMYLFIFITLYIFRAHRAHLQEGQIVSIQPLVTVILCWWPRCVQVGRRNKYIEKNLCITLVIYQESACGMLYPVRCMLVIWCRGTYLVSSSAPDHQPTTYWVQHTTSCIARSNAPEDGHNCCPKHVELSWIS